MKPQKVLNAILQYHFLATLYQTLGGRDPALRRRGFLPLRQKLVTLEKRTQWLAWIELLLKKIVMRAIANAKIFIQNIIQRVGKLLLGECFDNRLLANKNEPSSI